MATWKQLHDIAKSAVEIDFDTIEFMQWNGNGSEIHFNNGRTLTVRESPKEHSQAHCGKYSSGASSV